MRWCAVALAWVFIGCGPIHALSALIVDPPKPITHRVSVQIIETALNNGTSPATIFGDATQRADIEAGIDSIWAQAGIDIAFVPNIVRYNNTFAYQGDGGSRPTGDLGRITSAAAGIMNPTSSVINMFFVNIVPGFDFTSESTVNGIANIGRDGTAQFVGDNLLGGENGRDSISRVVAHEIGHNLGLFHAASGGPNLMSSPSTTSQLTVEQIVAIFQTAFRNDSVAHIPSGGTGFPQLIPIVGLPGDYNDDGTVDAADYSLWRNTLGSTTNLLADGNGNGVIDSGDQAIWKANFGRGGGSGVVLASATPEPATLAYAILALAVGGMLSRRQPRKHVP